MAIPVENFFLDNTTQGTLQTRVQQMIASGILSGRFERGEKLPSTRKLANHSGVSRITVSLAFTNFSLMIISRPKIVLVFMFQKCPSSAIFFKNIGRQDKVDWSKMIGQKFSIENLLSKPQNWSSFPYPFIYGQQTQVFSTTLTGGNVRLWH